MKEYLVLHCIGGKTCHVASQHDKELPAFDALRAYVAKHPNDRVLLVRLHTEYQGDIAQREREKRQ